ncbi:MAG: hypothetical protein ACI8W8_002803 [Rhodothermales bacterium]
MKASDESRPVAATSRPVVDEITDTIAILLRGFAKSINPLRLPQRQKDHKKTQFRVKKSWFRALYPAGGLIHEVYLLANFRGLRSGYFFA